MGERKGTLEGVAGVILWAGEAGVWQLWQQKIK